MLLICTHRHVDDFHTLQKDRLMTMNFAATKALDAELRTLEQQYADLQQKYEAEQRLCEQQRQLLLGLAARVTALEA